MAVDLGGLLFLMVLYVGILLVGLWADWKRKEVSRSNAAEDARTIARRSVLVNLNQDDQNENEDTPPAVNSVENDNETARTTLYDRRDNITDDERVSMLAGRNIGLFMGSVSLTVTWVGEIKMATTVYETNGGLIGTQYAWGYAGSLIVGGYFFARVMRDRGYVTMLDPLQEKYGLIMGGVLFLPAVLGELLWTSALLASLGRAIAVILEIDDVYSIIVSATVAIVYTSFGGLYSVAVTDIFQFFYMFFGLWFCIPFVLANDHVENIFTTFDEWKGHVEAKHIGKYIDHALLLILGGVPWQVYFQRVLTTKTPEQSMWLSFFAAGGYFVTSICPMLFGAAARSVKDWTKVGYPSEQIESKLIVSLVLKYLTPKTVAWVGLGGICAARMSSVDSCFLSASTMFTRNIYKHIFRPQASSQEIAFTRKLSTISVGLISTIISITDPSAYALFYFCSDLVYVILFPNLVGSLFIPYTNAYGSAFSCVVGFFFRISIGIDYFGWHPFINYFGYNKEDGHVLPVHTFSMLVCFATLLSVSRLSELLLPRLPPKYDVFKCFTAKPSRPSTAAITRAA